MTDHTKHLQQQILAACRDNSACRIEGGNSKAFIGNASNGELISTAQHSGIISYDASELVITARSGTPLSEIQQALAANNQQLAFEPPAFSEQATIGGSIACNLSGPARAYLGAARDFVLGCRLINGKGELLQFGGQVMKNVAGYDASRLMAGAYGTLGVLLEISLKVLPKPQSQITVKIPQVANDAILIINQLAAKNLPITASCYLDHHLTIRLNSSQQNTVAASQFICKQTGGRVIEDDKGFWQSIREQTHQFFDSSTPVARLSVPACSQLDLAGEQLIEWGGALRWLKTEQDIDSLRDEIKPIGGHVTAYKNFKPSAEYFQPLDSSNKLLQQRLKQAFDPAAILNPGRLYKEF
ncbi:MAG: glycolate oxidase subunit GlcE [Gammaproteobacteria bacterium]|nr:glycolate oxidase subunit GlcE [Gammaproteobacteria bacterium]